MGGRGAGGRSGHRLCSDFPVTTQDFINSHSCVAPGLAAGRKDGTDSPECQGQGARAMHGRPERGANWDGQWCSWWCGRADGLATMSPRHRSHWLQVHTAPGLTLPPPQGPSYLSGHFSSGESAPWDTFVCEPLLLTPPASCSHR